MEPVIAMDMEEMKNVDIRTVDRESLADINDVIENCHEKKEWRILSVKSKIPIAIVVGRLW